MHDISWGTKGDVQSTVSSEHMNVALGPDSQTALVDFPINQTDINETYKLFAQELSRIKSEKVKAAISQEDYFRAFRTRLLLFWIISNAVLIAFFTMPNMGIISMDPRAFNPFLTFILWSVSILSAIRFTGCVMYLISRRNVVFV